MLWPPNRTLSTKLINRLRNLLLRNARLQALIWCQVTPRWKVKYGHRNPKKYNRDVIKFHTAMREKIKPVDRLHHWHHKGLARATKEVMKDGVHPTTAEKGKKKYMGSISGLCRWTRLNHAASSSSEDESDEEETED